MNWKVVLVVFWATAFSLNVQAQEEDHPYQAFRTGTFVYDDYPTEVRVVRTKNRQTEYYNQGQNKMVLKIEWLNDSTYVLTQARKTETPGCLKKGDQILTTITGTYPGGYTYASLSKTCGSSTGKIRKLEE